MERQGHNLAGGVFAVIGATYLPGRAKTPKSTSE